MNFEEKIMSKDKYVSIFLKSNGGYCVYYPSNIFRNMRESAGSAILSYRKIPKISPGAYIFQRTFLRGLFLEGAYIRRGLL